MSDAAAVYGMDKLKIQANDAMVNSDPEERWGWDIVTEKYGAVVATVYNSRAWAEAMIRDI